ncbi:hypothetical protein OKW50_008161 [Paraburkholderia youngii]
MAEIVRLTHPSGETMHPAEQLEEAGLRAKRHGDKRNVDPFTQAKNQCVSTRTWAIAREPKTIPIGRRAA